jgi:sulfate adenylyltransferase subunit 2
MKTPTPALPITTPGEWWTARRARAVLAGIEPKSRRSLERRLRACVDWPTALTLEAVRDEAGRALNPLLLSALAAQARRKRQHLLTLQSRALPNGQACLHAEDARGMRYWFVLQSRGPAGGPICGLASGIEHPGDTGGDTGDTANSEDLEFVTELTAALSALAALHPRGVVLLPHGSLARYRGLAGEHIPWVIYADAAYNPISLTHSDRAPPEPAPVGPIAVHDISKLTLPPLGRTHGAPDEPLAKQVASSSDSTNFFDPPSLNESILAELEAESLHILREALAGARKPVMLFSAGKDSAVLLHLLRKACYPALARVPLLHIDTRWKFRAMYRYRDTIAEAANLPLEVFINPQAIKDDVNPFDHGATRHTEITKTLGLRMALDQGGYDTIIAGARRDEEASRAKERKFSVRSEGHRWDPRKQRPEPWNLYHGGLSTGETLRVFPLSNWREIDIWRYIDRERLPLVDLYFSAIRPVVQREGQWIVIDDERYRLQKSDRIQYRAVRFRSLGCYPLTAAIESTAATVREIIEELELSSQSERQGRVIDRDRPGSMELKKREGYF